MERVSKKIILAGDVGVGKTSLIRRYVHKVFSEEYRATLGFKVDKKNIEVDGKQVTLLIWDVAGETNMIDIFYAHYKSSDGIIYVFDVTRPPGESKVLEDIRVLNKFLKDVPIIIVGNKLDLLGTDPDLSSVDLKADLYTSAKSGENVEQMFSEIASKAMSLD